MRGEDLFAEAVGMVDDSLSTEQAALYLVAQADGSVERLLYAEQRAAALVGALPDDGRAARLHDINTEAARLALRTPTTARHTGLSARLAERTGSPLAAVDGGQLDADLERLRAAEPR